jgi:hypothetical protein
MRRRGSELEIGLDDSVAAPYNIDGSPITVVLTTSSGAIRLRRLRLTPTADSTGSASAPWQSLARMEDKR